MSDREANIQRGSEARFRMDTDRQQYTLYRRSVPAAGVVVAVNAGAVAIASYFSGSDALVAGGWYAALLMISIIRFVMWRRRPEGSEASPQLIKTTLNEAAIWSVLIGGAFGLASILFFRAGDLPFQFFISVVVAGMCAGTAAILNPIPKVTIAYLGAALLPQAGIMFYAGQPLTIAVGVLGVVYFIILSVGSISSFKTLVELVKTTNDAADAEADLMDAIESTSDAFATFGDDGMLRRSNNRFNSWFPNTSDSSVLKSSTEPVELPNGRWVIGSLRPTNHDGFVSVHTDVTALKKRETELIEARQQAEFANQTKARFLATMSHELRTPLNIIIGFSRLMGDGSRIKISQEEVAEYAGHIQESGDQLLALINDIIDFTQVGSDEYRLELKPTSVEPLIDWAANMAKSQSPEFENAEIAVSISSEIDQLRLDESAVRRVLVNVLDNALKFSPNAKRISIRAGQDRKGRPFISVRDKGIGIPEREIPKVCSAFYQVDATMQRAFGGTGLGLTLASELMKLHGGGIHIASREGEGSTVTLVFPNASYIPVGESGTALEDSIEAALDEMDMRDVS